MSRRCLQRIPVPALALAVFLAGCAGAGARGAADLLLLQDGEDGRLLLDPRGRFVNLVLPPTPLRALRTGPWTRFKSQRVTRILYRSFRDDFDIVIMAFAEDVALAGVGGRSELASLPVDGLGHPRGGRTGPFGSEGRLRSAIMLGNHPWLVRGPSLHEIAHAWGQWIVDRPQGGHWGFAGVGGQLGGWAPGTLEEVADGQWLARGLDGSVGFGLIDPGGNRHPYAPLELYLMGLLAADSVPPFRVAEDATWVRENLGHFRASRIRRMTVEDVIAEHGVRSPAPGDAPKRFRVLYAVISATPLDGATRTGIDRDVEGFARAGPGPREGWLNFWEATGGRARLVMDGLRESLRTPLAPTGGSADPPGGLSTPHPP